MWTRKFWADAAERMGKTAVQVLVAFLADYSATGHVDWSTAGRVAAYTVAASLVTSLGSSRVGDSSSASLVDTGRR